MRTAHATDTEPTEDTMSTPLTEADQAAVRGVWDILIDANLTTDFDNFAAHCTEDFVHLDPRSAVIVGVKPWKEWANAQDFADVEADFNVREIAGDGDLAPTGGA
jgi:ketosteroid isomerase-like protein